MTVRQPTEERRRQIADAALKVIAERGLGRFTTQAIAAEIGVTDATLFRHFASKEDIVLAALDRVEERLFEGFPPEDPDPLVRLERFFRFRASLVGATPMIARLAFSDELPHAAGPRGTQQVESWKQRSLDFIVSCMDEAAAQGRIPRGLPVREVGVMVLGTLIALVRFGELAAGPAAADRAWSVIERMIGRK
ncbi:MAG: TetR/AcrR family transcriptional regulator [Gemmatimonadetes bacterium]|nr:TetR/AcrR family transcriptional regulator [Gemmatimonadota bacterium]HQW66988.1 TetR/AcrR family transcriptional regulator [Gemmatimonadales bacterium]